MRPLRQEIHMGKNMQNRGGTVQAANGRRANIPSLLVILSRCHGQNFPDFLISWCVVAGFRHVNQVGYSSKQGVEEINSNKTCVPALSGGVDIKSHVEAAKEVIRASR